MTQFINQGKHLFKIEKGKKVYISSYKSEEGEKKAKGMAKSLTIASNQEVSKEAREEAKKHQPVIMGTYERDRSGYKQDLRMGRIKE